MQNSSSRKILKSDTRNPSVSCEKHEFCKNACKICKCPTRAAGSYRPTVLCGVWRAGGPARHFSGGLPAAMRPTGSHCDEVIALMAVRACYGWHLNAFLPLRRSCPAVKTTCSGHAIKQERRHDADGVSVRKLGVTALVVQATLSRSSCTA